MRIRSAVIVLTSTASITIVPLIAAVPADASDASVRSAIKTSAKQVKESGELQGALKEIKDNPKTIAKLEQGLKDFVVILRKVVSKVETQTASTTNGKRGETDWTAGIHKGIKGFEDLGLALGDLKSDHKTPAKTKLKEAATLVKAGAVEAKRGEALLGIKES